MRYVKSITCTGSQNEEETYVRRAYGLFDFAREGLV